MKEFILENDWLYYGLYLMVITGVVIYTLYSSTGVEGIPETEEPDDD